MKQKNKIYRRYPISWIIISMGLFISPITLYAQMNVISWYIFDAGTSISASSGNTIRSSVGQTFIGTTSPSGTIINSGFLVDTLFGRSTVGVNENQALAPLRFELMQNFPNPFNPSTTITFSVGTYSHTSLRVYDVIGREVTTIFSGELSAGSYTKQWNAVNLPSGVYFYRLEVYPDAVGAGSFVETKKLLLIK